MKRLQHKISESTLTLPVVAVLVFLVWLIVTMADGCHEAVYQQCPQLVCLAASTYLMVELSNANSLLRVRSRMVPATFLALSAMSCSLIPSLPGGIAQLCFIGMLIILLRTYQDKQAPGWTFYAFLCLGLGSFVFVHLLLLVPLLWLLMATQLQSHSFRNYLASLIGLLTPYWFIMPWVFYKQDFTPLVDHFRALGSFSRPNYAVLTMGQVSGYVFTIVVAAIGILHFWQHSYEDKIRTRQFYGLFISVMLICSTWLALQPQLFDGLMQIIIVCASPIIAHFFAHTNTRVSNIFFTTSLVLAAAITVLNILSLQWQQLTSTATTLWNGLLSF